MQYRERLQLLLWILWGLALALLVSAGLWFVLTAGGDATGAKAGRSMTIVIATLAVSDLAALVVCIARRELE